MLESEARSMIENKISLPAYDQCLKSSHVFNILDARGVISVAQRAEYISRNSRFNQRDWKNLDRKSELKCLNYLLNYLAKKFQQNYKSKQENN